MIWNYRVFREEDGGLSIREVFYEQDGSILACSEPVRMEADSIAELTAQLEALREALDQPVLTLADVPAPDQARARGKPQPTLAHQEVLSRLGLISQAG